MSVANFCRHNKLFEQLVRKYPRRAWALYNPGLLRVSSKEMSRISCDAVWLTECVLPSIDVVPHLANPYNMKNVAIHLRT